MTRASSTPAAARRAFFADVRATARLDIDWTPAFKDVDPAIHGSALPPALTRAYRGCTTYRAGLAGHYRAEGRRWSIDIDLNYPAGTQGRRAVEALIRQYEAAARITEAGAAVRKRRSAA